MADELYRGDLLYVPYMKGDLLRTLCRLVYEEKSYMAFAVEEDGKFLARVLCTVAPSKQYKMEKCGYFSHFECVDDETVSDLLLTEMCRALKERGATRVEGTYFPYDQDNRRGILAEGFGKEPMVLTSYNPPYYCKLLEAFGFTKDFDTVSYLLDYDRFDFERIGRITARVLERYGLYISSADFHNLDREIDAFHEVMQAATTDVIYQAAPDTDVLRRTVKSWKSFLWSDLIFICRRREDDKPVGVMMSIPNYFEVFRKMKGKTTPISLCKALWYRSRLRSVRAILQYVIPEYQNKGVNFALYHAFYRACKKRKIVHMEAGTIMENNLPSRLNVERASGVLNKVFRIYGREL